MWGIGLKSELTLPLQEYALLFTRNEAFILDGEGILGLEAACASLTEQGDKVLVVDNGIYGKGFADFATMYGGQVTYYTPHWCIVILPAAC